MEHTSIKINEPDQFDRLVHGDDKAPALPSNAELEIVTKNGGMASGAACVAISWLVDVDGKARRAQFSTSVKQLISLLRILDSAYFETGFPRPGTYGEPGAASDDRMGVSAGAATPEGDQVLVLGITRVHVDEIRNGREVRYQSASLSQLGMGPLPDIRIMYRDTAKELVDFLQGQGAERQD